MLPILRPDIQQIVFRDAPNVIGQSEWREIEVKYGFGLILQALKNLSEQGEIDDLDPELTAQILLGAIFEAAHGVATSKNKLKSLGQGKAIIRTMVRALRKRG